MEKKKTERKKKRNGISSLTPEDVIIILNKFASRKNGLTRAHLDVYGGLVAHLAQLRAETFIEPKDERARKKNIEVRNLIDNHLKGLVKICEEEVQLNRKMRTSKL